MITASSVITPAQPAPRSPKNRKRVSFLVNSSPDGAMGIRARSFAALLPEFDIQICYRGSSKLRAIRSFLLEIRRHRPETIYVFDMAYSGVAAGILYARLFGCRLMIDTGDAIGFLADSIGERSWLGRQFTHWLESASLRFADLLVVRSHFHAEYLAGKTRAVRAIPDGVDLAQFAIACSAHLRETWGMQDCFTVGFVGSVTWNERWQMCYGSELVAALACLRHLPVKGIVIGDGTGLERLKAMAHSFGVSDRIRFVGRVAYDTLPAYLQTIDLCLSTQTNDLAGQVRTTGKLPLYLASGRFVLSTRVGEAARVLPEAMLLDYHGTKDESYPARLAARIEELLRSGQWCTGAGSVSRNIARKHFDYQVLGQRVRRCLTKLNGDDLSTDIINPSGKVVAVGTRGVIQQSNSNSHKKS